MSKFEIVHLLSNEPIGHEDESGDYSWEHIPLESSDYDSAIKEAKDMGYFPCEVSEVK